MLIFVIYYFKWENEEINLRFYFIYLYNCEEKIIEKKIFDLVGCLNFNCVIMGVFIIIILFEVWWIWLKERDFIVSGVIVNKLNFCFCRIFVCCYEKYFCWYGKYFCWYGICFCWCGICFLFLMMVILGFCFEDWILFCWCMNFVIVCVWL